MGVDGLAPGPLMRARRQRASRALDQLVIALAGTNGGAGSCRVIEKLLSA
jgi:hypothetical protein